MSFNKSARENNATDKKDLLDLAAFHLPEQHKPRRSARRESTNSNMTRSNK